MENPTNSDLSKQIETVAQTVAQIYAKMATKEELSELRGEMNNRFDILERWIDRIEKSHDFRITSLEREVADIRA